MTDTFKMSNYLEKKLLDHTLRNTAYTQPAGLYVQLYTSDPTDADSGSKVSAGGHTRQAVTFGAATGTSDTTALSTNDVAFTASGGNFGTVSHIGIFDAVSSGNLLFYGPLAVAQAVLDTQTLDFAIGSLAISMD